MIERAMQVVSHLTMAVYIGSLHDVLKLDMDCI